MIERDLLGWFTFLLGMLGGAGMGIWMIVGMCNIGKDRKKEKTAE